MSFREQNNSGGNWQIFVHDPSGLKLELTFEAAGEVSLPIPVKQSQRYQASERFFNPEEYVQFAQ